MPAPVTKTFYFNTASFPGTTFGGILEVAPPNTATTWGWIVGQNNPPLHCEMNWNVEIVRTSAQWQAAPTASGPTQATGLSAAGNGWMVGPYNGEFLGGTWYITQSVAAVTNAAGQDGRFVYRFWTCSSGSGINASLVTSSFISSSVIVNLSTTPVQLSTSVVLPKIILRNGFLFLQTYWSITGTSTNNAADVDYVFGALSGTMIPTRFVGDYVTNVGWLGNSDL